ncbi:MAG: hypothetical protein EU548_04180, partial [Promethearchaeota archaeon]
MANREILKQKEGKLKKLAKIAWAKTLEDFYFPPLEEPDYIFDYTHKEGFYINPDNRWKITMNLANTPIFLEDKEFIDYYFAISLHEVSHYQVIPYDGLINAKLLRAAMKYVNQIFAPIVVNIFADLHIDYRTYLKYPKLIEWELKSTYDKLIKNKELSEFTNFLFRAYELLMKINISEKPSTQWNSLAENVCKIVLENFYDDTTWEKKVEKIAYYLQDLINNTFTLIGKYVKTKKGSSKRKAPGKGTEFIEIPDDVLEVMDNPLENRNRDKLDSDNKD